MATNVATKCQAGSDKYVYLANRIIAFRVRSYYSAYATIIASCHETNATNAINYP